MDTSNAQDTASQHVWSLEDLPPPENLAPIFYEIWRQKKLLAGYTEWKSYITGENLLLGWDRLSAEAQNEDIGLIKIFYMILDIMMTQIDLLEGMPKGPSTHVI